MSDSTETKFKPANLEPKIHGSACHFSDSFQINARTDGLFLLEFFCHVPNGYQSNMLTMLSKPSLEKLQWVIEGALKVQPQAPSELPS
jgi:hypothetical protein